DVQAQTQHDVNQYQRCDVDFGTPGEERKDQGDRDQQEDHAAPRLVVKDGHGKAALALAQQMAEDRTNKSLEQEDRGHPVQDHVPLGFDVGLHAAANDLQPEYRCDDHPGHDGRDERILDLTRHYTFSTSGLPRSPVGRNNRISTSRLNATMSLYCDDM